MSQNEDNVLLDVKVYKLNTELNQCDQHQRHTKPEYVANLNEALGTNSSSANNTNTTPGVSRKETRILEDSIPSIGDINQSFDLALPNDDLLNMDDTTQEDQIQISLSKDEEADMNLEVRDSDKVFSDDKIEGRERYSESKCRYKENESDELINIEMHGGDNIDPVMKDGSDKKKIVKTKSKKSKKTSDNEERKEKTVHRSSRLGKRKLSKDNELENSPTTTKRKNRKEKIILDQGIEEPFRVKSPQKSKKIISDILRVDNLVRPFTMTQLQDVLSMRGRVVDFWLNKIKSVAYVKYDNESIAINARDSLDGCKWPSTNPKLLVADFATNAELEWMKEKGDSGINPPSYLSQPDTESQHKLRNGDKSNYPAKERNIYERKNIPLDKEWDSRRRRDEMDQDVKNREMRKRDRRDIRKEENIEKIKEKSIEKTKNAPPTKLLADLFRKTTTQPAIYWKPSSKDTKDASTKVPEFKKADDR